MEVFIITNGDKAKSDKNYTATKLGDTGASVLDRMLARPEFASPVLLGSNYYIVDDILLQAAYNQLHHHIDQNGGQVMGAALLASAFSRQVGYGANIDIQEKTICKIMTTSNEQELNNRWLLVPLTRSERLSLVEKTKQVFRQAAQAFKNRLEENEKTEKE